MGNMKQFSKRVRDTVVRHEKYLSGYDFIHDQLEKIEAELERRREEEVDRVVSIRLWQDKLARGGLTN